jgi:hypothetical protein
MSAGMHVVVYSWGTPIHTCNYENGVWSVDWMKGEPPELTSTFTLLSSIKESFALNDQVNESMAATLRVSLIELETREDIDELTIDATAIGRGGVSFFVVNGYPYLEQADPNDRQLDRASLEEGVLDLALITDLRAFWLRVASLFRRPAFEATN